MLLKCIIIYFTYIYQFSLFAGIPESEELANTFYSQFNDDFEESSPEREEADEEEDEEEEGEGTLVAGHEDEMADYISRLEGALDMPSNGQ